MVNLAPTSTVLVYPNLLELERLDNFFLSGTILMNLDLVEQSQTGPNSNHVGIDVNNLILVDSSAAGYYDRDGAFHNLASPVGNR